MRICLIIKNTQAKMHMRMRIDACRVRAWNYTINRTKHGDDNESPVVLLRIYTRSATRRQTVMVDINLLLSHFPRFLVCFATMAAEL